MKKSYPPTDQQWLRMVLKQMSHLSKPQAVVLAMWSLAIAMTHSCGLSTATVFLAEMLEQPENKITERLRQWYCGGGTNKGRKRSPINVEQSFVPLLRWILSWWSSQENSLVLAADASTLGQRFTLLVISVVYRGCGIPYAWKIVVATEPGSWKPHWYGMRSWIECLFKDIKRGGFGWHHTKMNNPERAERLWLAIAVSTLFLVSVGGQAEAKLSASSLPPINEIQSDVETDESLTPDLTTSRGFNRSPTRLLSCFRRGFLVILASVIKQMPLPKGGFVPDFSPATG